MRCSKCGYISFDSMDSCSKCATSLADLINEVQGTAFQVDLPFFLGSLVSDTSGMPVTDDEGLEIDLSMSEEDMQHLDDSLDDEISLDDHDVVGLDLSSLDDESVVAPIDPEADEATVELSAEDDEVLDLSDLMDEDDL